MADKSNMYTGYTSWNPFKGCEYDCVYCIPSYQRQAKRQKHNCTNCYNFIPHFHAERLDIIPSSSYIFACANSDVSFCPTDQLENIIDVIFRRQDRIFLLQSKNPSTFNRIKEYPSNLILGTTIETNIEALYDGISKAPLPKERIKGLAQIKHDRKFITMEPLLKFIHKGMLKWVDVIHPECIWMGFNTQRSIKLNEPSTDEVNLLYNDLISQGYNVITM